jgi:mono/diheme cytochrome c family protein
MSAFVALLLLALAGRFGTLAERISVERTASQHAAVDRTTADGVYTAVQAETGAALFVEVCQSCHVPNWERTVSFYSKWHGKPLGHLMTYVRREMPQTDPGSLTPEEYGQVTAYLLRLTGMPAGAETLNPDPAALSEIRIDTLPSTRR